MTGPVEPTDNEPARWTEWWERNLAADRRWHFEQNVARLMQPDVVILDDPVPVVADPAWRDALHGGVSQPWRRRHRRWLILRWYRARRS